MQKQIAGIIYILITLALVNEMSINVYARDNSKRKSKDKIGGFQKNICDVTDRDSKVHCYCEKSRELGNATKAECWVFNGGIPRDDYIWQSFASQPNVLTLSFNVRVDGALEYIPTKALLYLHYLKSINIKYGDIGDITPFSLANLTYLKEANLSQNQIKTLQQYSFAHLPNMNIINLEDNLIFDIYSNAFYDLPKLEKMVLTKNNLSIIRNGTFQYMFKLLELDLNKNGIYNLNRRTFDGLANLIKLDLSNNRIENLTEFTFAELWNLHELLLSKNELHFVSERAFDGLSLLRKLSLDGNKLTSLPSGLFEGVRGLSSLDLRSNKLYTLTFENIKPILDNLKPLNSNLLIEDNHFVCDCTLEWIHVLSNETRSQSTKESLKAATCYLSLSISSAHNKVAETIDDNKLDYNQGILHAGLTIEVSTIVNRINSIQRNSSSVENLIKDSNEITANVIKKTVLDIPLDALPCFKEVEITTELPLQVDLVVPVQHEMKTYRFYDINNGDIQLKSRIVVICIIFGYFFK